MELYDKTYVVRRKSGCSAETGSGNRSDKTAVADRETGWIQEIFRKDN